MKIPASRSYAPRRRERIFDLAEGGGKRSAQAEGSTVPVVNPTGQPEVAANASAQPTPACAEVLVARFVVGAGVGATSSGPNLRVS